MKHVLLIEDDVDLLQLFAAALKEAGFLVTKFSDPIKACLDFEANPYSYDLVLSDIRMPGMSGLDLVRRIKNINNRVNVILMSAYEIDNLDSKLRQLGLDTFLQKPIHIEKLISAIKRSFEQH